MILKTQVCEKFGIERPIFGFSHSVAVTAAVTNAGGLGVWGATHHEPHNIGPQIAQIHADSKAGPSPLSNMKNS